MLTNLVTPDNVSDAPAPSAYAEEVTAPVSAEVGWALMDFAGVLTESEKLVIELDTSGTPGAFTSLVMESDLVRDDDFDLIVAFSADGSARVRTEPPTMIASPAANCGVAAHPHTPGSVFEGSAGH